MAKRFTISVRDLIKEYLKVHVFAFNYSFKKWVEEEYGILHTDSTYERIARAMALSGEITRQKVHGKVIYN